MLYGTSILSGLVVNPLDVVLPIHIHERRGSFGCREGAARSSNSSGVMHRPRDADLEDLRRYRMFLIMGNVFFFFFVNSFVR